MAAKKVEESIVLTRGSRYLIRSLESREKPLATSGVFKGYTILGGDEAICIELDELHEKMQGKVRVIPCHMVLAIDIMATAKPDSEKKEPDEAARYFG